MAFKKVSAAAPKDEYSKIGKIIAYRPDHEKIAIRGIAVIENDGFDFVLFFPKPESVNKAEENGWEVPVAEGNIKQGETVIYWVRAYGADRDDICCKLQLTKNDSTKEKYSATLFYNKDCPDVLEGNVQTKAPF